MKRELSKKAKLSIFKAVFVPILTYGHESWVMNAIGSHFARVQSQRWSPRGRPWPRGYILKSLASKVKSLALASKPQSPRKLPCPRLEDSTIFGIVKLCISIIING